MSKSRRLSGLMTLALVVTFALLTTAACGTIPAPLTPAESDAKSRMQVGETYGKLPLHFETNQGQADGQVKFLARGAGRTLFLTSTEAVLVFTKREQTVTQTVIRMTFLGANPQPRMVGSEELPGKANYFIGKDPAKWRTNVPTYAKVRYANVYPGIDLIYYGNQRQLEYDLVVHPGGDPGAIVLAFHGADKAEVDAQGDLALHTASGAIRQRKPIIYQEIGGVRREIAGAYALEGERVGIRVASYDASRPLVIDPVLDYATYLGGSGDDSVLGIAVDASGNLYVAGQTGSTDFPTSAGAFQPSFGGGAISGPADAVVTKLNPSGSAVVYSTYLGGSDNESVVGIAVDVAGNAYVTGSTSSTNFPTVAAFQSAYGGGISNAFVTKLNPVGSGLVYSTYLGGSGGDYGGGIAVDAAGNAYVVGSTSSTDFPTSAGAFQAVLRGGDAFVTKLDPSGSTLVYSTLLGGTSGDAGHGIAVDAGGNAYVAGTTTSADFPTTPGAFQPTLSSNLGPGYADGFVTKLNAVGTALVYSTYLGGSNSDQVFSIAVDAAGNAYVTGITKSLDFPTVSAFQSSFGTFVPNPHGPGTAFVTKINPVGSALVYSTYLGGSDQSSGTGIAVDASGSAYVTGFTFAMDFPTTAGAFPFGGAEDVFVTKFVPSGSALVYSTYLGGSGPDYGGAIALDASGNAYVTGSTASSIDFPVTSGGFQATFQGGGADAFVAKISVNTPAGTNVSASAGNGVTVNFPAVISPGETTAPTSSTGPTPPAGFALGTPPTYYDIRTTATYSPPVSVCITYDPAQFSDPSSLRLLHFENDAWVDVTTSSDTTNHVICGQVSSFSFFAVAQRSGSPLTSLGPANIWVGLKNSDDVGIRFDLRAEVYRNGTQLVGSGEVASVPGGSSGFNNAKQDTINLTPVGGATFRSGDTVSIKLYVRNACSASGKNSGTARLWFNDGAANSRFVATIGNPKTYYLRAAFALATSPGPGPKQTIDVAAGAKCSSYKTFGTWSTTIQ